MALQIQYKARYVCCWMMNFLAAKLKRPHKMQSSPADTTSVEDIVVNGDFDNGLQGWNTSYGCSSSVYDSGSYRGIGPHTGSCFIVVSGRTQGWQGVEQDITNRLLANIKHEVYATVRIAGTACSQADVMATLKLENKDSETKYVPLGRTKASVDGWTMLRGTLHLDVLPEKIIFYLEGPPSGTDILVDSVHIRRPVSSGLHNVKERGIGPKENEASLLSNSDFSNGLSGWSGRSCTLLLGPCPSHPLSPCAGEHYAVAANRSQGWHGVEQEVTGRLRAKIMYDVHAMVRLHGNSKAEVLATLYLRKNNSQEQYMTLGRTWASSEEWSELRGKFTIHSLPIAAVIFIEGPPAGVDILVDSFSVCPAKPPKPSPPPHFENPMFGINIIENSSFCRGLSGWSPMGSCTLHVAATGAPLTTPPSGKGSLKMHTPFTGKYIVATNRKFGWEGPSQKLTQKVQLFLSYQVSAWIRIGNCRSAEKVNVALSVDGQWVTGGEVEACSSTWKEVAGTFRLEKSPSDVTVYVQGPAPGVDIMVANLQIFSVNRSDRFTDLKLQTEKVRKRDTVLRIRNSSKLPASAAIHVKQTSSSFPIGACINRCNLENSEYVNFFLRHFDITVFENELKWGWTEPEKGKLNYKDADELCKFCSNHNIPVRGHCVFWEVESCVQSWVKQLNRNELKAAVDNRISSLVTRYRGKFRHYDVNNEMLHGDFYRSRLDADVHSHMFKRIHQLDPSPKLFVNDYHVEDGHDANSCPEKYVQQIQALVSQGAPVGGIGIQAHIDVPVGSVLSQAFDTLAMLGLPIWLTELDVCSTNEHVRADDLEVVLREAFAHPAVEGVILWGFWEGCSRADGHLVNVDGTVNEAGKRLQALKREWQTEASGSLDEEGKFEFRGFCGSYKIVIDMGNGKLVERSFEVAGEEERSEIDIIF